MNNKLSVITAFLGGVKNRYMQYKPNIDIVDKLELASNISGVDGVELCYPGDFKDVSQLKKVLADTGLGVSAINVRSRMEGKWLRGAFSSNSKGERQEVVEMFKKAMDHAADIGCNRITTCPLNDGHDYVFELNYFDAFKYAGETFSAICDHNDKVKVCIEYKINDPRTRCLFGTAGETLSFCESLRKENLGATMDIGHSILGGERPAQALVMLHNAGKLFYVHLNDNDKKWDWDMLPAAYNLWELIEFLYYLEKVGYDNDWYAYDVMSKEIDTKRHFELVAKLTRKAEALTEKIDREKMDSLLKERNPVASFEYLNDVIL
jgi:xylose isomerase